MKRSTSCVLKQFHKRFDTVEQYVQELGGSEKRVIEKVLIANNGVAAIKAIRSIRKWAYEVFGDERAIQFVVMATPEDLRANAEYIRMADTIVDVPGSSNNHNYANVTLIVELARLHGVQAVWAGWGHASENPLLPDTLAKSNPPIKFIGPAGAPMRALGDKIGSTIIAQTAGVPCIGWNGQDVKAEYDRTSGKLPDDAYRAASVESVTEAQECSSKIGFPIMIKASEGGGGKGIRMVDSAEKVADAYRQVCGEVPGSPIFIMKLSSNSRHLEVQLLADEYGDAIALNGRDCSVQRRHQKIIEEGPPVAANPNVWHEMEKAAINLAKAVGYANAGTVEYLYSESEEKFYFLELNPRLQVEHPVTEMITGVNLPAAQLQVAMGIPLKHIPDIRELYGKHRFEESCDTTDIDFATVKRRDPKSHCIAVRITAENAEAGFKPTSGGIQELNFRSTPNVWGYFSMDSSGCIHEFADSQFGHLFANGNDREQARRNMALALKELSIRGDISTTVDYISTLMELDDYVENNIHTGWLDELIKNGTVSLVKKQQQQAVADNNGDVTSLSPKSPRTPLSPRNVLSKGGVNPAHVSVVIGATVKAYDTCISEEKQFMEALQKGQLPSMSLLRVTHVVDLIFDNVKYKLKCERIGPNQFSIAVIKEDGSVMAGHVVTHVRMLSDGGYLIAKGTKSHVAYLINRGDAASGMRLSLNGSAISFSPDYDPTSLRTDVAGKLVKKLVKDGDHLHKGQAYGEIEVMKMFMPLKVEESGIISWNVNEGASLQPGTLMASLELDNPDNVATPQFFQEELNVTGWISSASKTKSGPPKIPLPLPISTSGTNNSRPHLMFRRAMEQLDVGIQGFLLNESSLNKALRDLEEASKHPLLPVLEMEEKLSVLRGRIDGNLFTQLHDMLETFKTDNAEGTSQWFDAATFQQLIMDFALSKLVDADERASFLGLVRPLLESVMPYVKRRIPGVPGSERVMDGLLELLRKWCSMERWFCSSTSDGSSSYADAFDQLRRMHKDDSKSVLEICRAHSQLATTSSKIVCRIIECIGDGSSSSNTAKSGLIPFDRELFERAEPCLSDIKNMNGGISSHKDAALRARKVLLQGSLPSITQRKSKLDALVKQELNDEPSEDESVVVEENETFADVLFPLLRDYSSNLKDQCGLLQVYAKQMFRTEVLKEVTSDETKGFVKVVYESNEGLRRSPSVLLGGSTSVNSLNDLTKLLKQSSSSNMLGSTDDIVAAAATEGNDNASAAVIVKSTSSMELPPNTTRYGIFQVVNSLKELNLETLCRTTLPPYQDPSKKCKSRAVNVLHILVLKNDSGDEELLSKQCEEIVQQSKSHLEQADVRRISFMFCKSTAASAPSKTSSGSNETTSESYPMPSIFTFRAPLAFREDSLFRNIEPKHAHYLELTRLAKNFTLRRISARHTSSGHVHLYKAKPKPTALAAEATIRNHRTLDHPRIYLRALSFVKDLTATNYERMLVDALNALDLLSITDHGVTSSNYTDNHLFINMVSSTAENQIVFDPIEVEQVISSILKRYGERITQLGIDEVETRVVCCVSEDTPPIVLRMVSSNPTGYVHVMNTYVEGESTDGSQQRVFRLVGGTKASLAGSGDSSWQDMSVDAPYPLTKPFELQRKAAMRASDTLYCYDLPALFEAAVERQWDVYHASTASAASTSASTKASAKSENTFVAPCRPLMLMYTAELVVQKKNSSDKTKWTMQDYLDGKLEMTQVQRGAGANDVGMVAWYMILKTVEYPEGRPLVIIANDITYQAGSFGTREDVVFKMASEYARQHKCPRLFMAANSGARIGLATAIKKSFKVAFKDPSKPENGFDYIYLSKEDYEQKFQSSGIVKAQEATYNGKTVYKITDVIGSEPDLGVENLKGSGLIAGETSSAYHDIVTMTVVLGRTVGIGAYLVRLGQRTIQKTTASPIILTGYQALNKLMGCEVYSTNDQLGGPGIMYSNGISHLVAKDHLAAITHAIEWLAYVPNIRGGMLPIRDLSATNGVVDTIDRVVEFTPQPNTPYDPRHLLGGCEDSTTGTWQSGFFDRNSFTETLAGWAKTVIVGRARLGGIPMGVVVTENRTSEHIKPADPADLKASESIVQEAGCVWFPNSAYKTAQAIQDFNVEDLPLMIFANWRGFSGGQRDMFDEVLKYGSLIVDAFVAYKQPVFVFIPPYGEIRGGAWVVLDSSINSSVMEMYATSTTARGGVLEASGAASVKYRTKDLLVTMHRLDSTLQTLDDKLRNCNNDERRKQLQQDISNREHSLLPVYEQISVQFCDLHDTPGRMKAVGVIERSVEWKFSRTFFYWRLRRKLIEFNLRQKIVEASEVGRFSTRLSPLEASSYIKQWFIEEQSSTTNSSAEQMWKEHDQAVVAWFGQNGTLLESRIKDLNRIFVSDEVYDVLTAGGETEVIGTDGMIQGISRALHKMDKSRRQQLKDALLAAIGEL